MATTHVFVVDTTTFKYHLEYMFAGTGAREYIVDFNNTRKSSLHPQTENNLVGMIADSQRIRTDDYVVFYLQQNFRDGVREGKFYGLFKVKEAPSFLDNNDEQQFLKSSLGKSLTFRTIIEPSQVYPEGVTEWEALDEIKNIYSPNQMLWSLIYRKLKGNRGNTMITIYESERLINLIRNKNNRKSIKGEGYTFNISTQRIETTNTIFSYEGRKEIINILPRLINKYCARRQFEIHLQVYILQNIEKLPMFVHQPIEWIGNEVSCGVGMQRIDIMLSIDGQNRKIVPIELKSVEAYPEMLTQLQRYVNWIEQYYLPNRPSDIEPMIISREIIDKTTRNYKKLINAFKLFNRKNSILPLKYIEFSIDCAKQKILFKEIKY